MTKSLGGAGRATTSGAEGPFLNPATLAINQNFQVGLFYGATNTESSGSSRDLAGIFIDNNPDSPVASSLSYARRSIEGPFGFMDQREDFVLSFGKTLLERVSFGLNVRYFRTSPNFGASKVLWNIGTGFLWSPMEDLGLALVFENMLDEHTPDQRPAVALGSHYLFMDITRFRLDLEAPQKFNNSNRLNVMAGLEFPLPVGLALRTGHRWDEVQDARYWTAGLGWEAPKLSLDYAYEQNSAVSGIYTHLLSLRIFF